MQQYFLLILTFAITTNLYSQFSGGAGTATNPYQITSKADIEALADSVGNYNPINSTNDNWSSYKYFKLMNDIHDSVKMVAFNMRDFADYARCFQGNFDGNHKKITLALDDNNLSFMNGHFIGLFPGIYNAKIYNLTVDGCVKGYSSIGGICGIALKSTILNCINRCNIISAITSSIIGGICGYSTGMSIFENCINDASINGDMYVGGICGYVSNAVQIINCQNNGPVNGGTCVGGIVGHTFISGNILYCTNSGTITANNYGAGGIVGHFIGDTIAYCINIGTIIGKNKTIKEFPSAYAGGIVGMGGFEKPNKPKTISLINNCINSGLIMGENSTGGIIGRAYPPDEIHTSLNTGVVIGNANAGGIAGEVNETAIIQNCYYDKQMCIYGGIAGQDIAGQAEGHLTKELIGNNLENKLGNADWTYSSLNLYPILSHFIQDTIAFIAISPTYLYNETDDFDRQNKVKTDFKVNLENDVKWDRIIGNVDIVNEDGLVRNSGSDTLVCSIGSYKKAVPINITLQPIGDVKFTIWATEHKQVAPTSSNYHIPIYIKSNAKTLQEIVIKKLTIEIDKNIFYLKQVNNNVTANSNRNLITVENVKIPPLNAGEEVVLFNLIGDVLLGTIDSSEIIINPNVEFTEKLNTAPEVKNGHITLNICHEGSDRFIGIADKSPSLSIKNNVVNDILEVECNVLESGKYVLEVVDMAGRSVKVEEFVANEVGAFLFEVDVAGFGVGRYLLVMGAPSGKRFVEKVVKR